MTVKFFKKLGWELNPNRKVVEGILKQIERNEGLCPCVHDTPDYEGKDLHCPCTDYVLHDKCCCTLYIQK